MDATAPRGTRAHMHKLSLTYLDGVVFARDGAIVLHGRNHLKERSVHVSGLRRPLGGEDRESLGAAGSLPGPHADLVLALFDAFLVRFWHDDVVLAGGVRVLRAPGVVVGAVVAESSHPVAARILEQQKLLRIRQEPNDKCLCSDRGKACCNCSRHAVYVGVLLEY